MDILILIKSGLGLMVILGVLVSLLIFPRRLKKKDLKKTKEVMPVKEKNDVLSLKELRKRVTSRESSTEELKDAIELIIKNYGTMYEKKSGVLSHPESDIYMDIVFKLCRHQNATTAMIVQFTNSLEKLNPQYGKGINNSMMRGLNSRKI